MTRNDPNIEVLAGPERRRRWSATEKVALVAEVLLQLCAADLVG
jgi:hypothetical protein